MDFREYLRDAIKKSGVTQHEFADAINVPFRTFLKWIQGAHMPNEWREAHVRACVADYLSELDGRDY